MNLSFEQRAEIQLRSLHGADQKQVTKAILTLNAMEPSAISGNRKLYKILAPTDTPLYVFRGSPRLRLVLAIDGEDCKVVDIVDHDLLERLLPRPSRLSATR